MCIDTVSLPNVSRYGDISIYRCISRNFIHQQLTEIKGTDNTEVYFGGLNIIPVGDFYQLLPVCDRFVF